MTPEQFQLYMVVNTLVAIGTIGAVIVALFQAFWVKLWPPKLTFNIVDHAGEKTYFANPKPGQASAVRYYHLHVLNLRRWSPARDVSLHLIGVEVPAVGGGGFERAWFGSIPIRCRHQEIYPLQQTIGTAVDYDLCSISEEGPVLALMPIITPTNLRCQFRIEVRFVASFQAKAAECDSKVLRVEFAWDGQWEGGDTEMQRHFKLKVLNP
jgi:hypothetical protein